MTSKFPARWKLGIHYLEKTVFRKSNRIVISKVRQSGLFISGDSDAPSCTPRFSPISDKNGRSFCSQAHKERKGAVLDLCYSAAAIMAAYLPGDRNTGLLNSPGDTRLLTPLVLFCCAGRW